MRVLAGARAPFSPHIMRNIRIALWGIPLALIALWLLADPKGLFPQPFTYFGFRGGAVQLSGILAIASMTACMVLATRARVLEGLFGGLDKMYRLHKWMGIMALVTAKTGHFSPLPVKSSLARMEL